MSPLAGVRLSLCVLHLGLVLLASLVTADAEDLAGLVTADAEAPQILNKFEKLLMREGRNLNISCLARGVPKPRLEWLFKDRPVAKQYLSAVETANEEFAETRIIIKSVTELQEGVYQCEAKNNVGTVVKNSHVSVISRTKVVITNDSPKEITSAAGQKLKLPCKYSNDPLNRITNLIWMKNGKTLEASTDFGFNRGYDGSITFPNVQKQHEGTYKCIVVTVLYQDSDQVKLNVLVNAPVITSFTKDRKVFSGTSLVVECISNGIPQPITKWTFNETITNKHGHSYEINNAIATDAGDYTCTARNSIGEARKTVRISVVTLPKVKKEKHTKVGARLKLPCVKPAKDVLVIWRKDGHGLGENNMDGEGSIVIENMTEGDEGNYTCLVEIVGGERRLLQTKVRMVSDIVTSGRVEVKEGDNITLKCNVLPGINTKRLWKKNGDLVFPGWGLYESMEISNKGGLLTLSFAKVSDTGEFACVATTCFGESLYTCVNEVKETISYEVIVQQRSSRNRDSCSNIDPPVITSIESVSNTSVRLEWSTPNFNASCHEAFRIFWWTNDSNANYDKRNVELNHRAAVIEGLRPELTYYFQVNLVRNEAQGFYVYGQTKTHMLRFIDPIQGQSTNSWREILLSIIDRVMFIFVF